MRENKEEIQELKKASGVSQNVSHQVSLLASKVSCTSVLYSSSTLSFLFFRIRCLLIHFGISGLQFRELGQSPYLTSA